ncbi:MAG: hypothetical protein Q8P41_10035 [Pseudomonadota bacterium]|nr:hypothetical protein [Pseudomonadota bacterium]
MTPPSRSPLARTPLARNVVTVALFSAVAVVFTWPLALDPVGQHVSLHFDHYGVVWASAAIESVDGALRTDLSTWPLGKSLLRADSFVLLALARVLGLFGASAWAAPVCALAGPVLSAWAAERVAARTFGARWPWSIVAGLAYGFSGLGMTALLEGHDYALLNPWLPLLAERVWRMAAPEGRVRDGVLAAVYWSLALLTTAYVGIAATLLTVALLARGAWLRTARPAPLLAAAGVVLPVVLAYVAAFTADGDVTRRASDTTAGPRELMAAGSARLGTLLTWTPSADLVQHSVVPSLGITAVVLALVAPRVLRGQPGWKTLLGGTLLTVALSLGPRVQLNVNDLSLPWILTPLASLPGAEFFRFPSRLLWIAGLGVGLVAARVATRLAEVAPGPARFLLVFAVLDLFVATGAPLRTKAVPNLVPSAYAATAVGWPVLELYPPFYGSQRDLDVFVGNLTCSYQVAHARPLLHDCLTTTLRSSPAHTLMPWLMDRALAPEASAAEVRARFDELGIGAVALHPGLYAADDRAELVAGLRRLLGEPTAESRDGGEHVVVWALAAPGSPPPSRAAAEARWLALRGAP